MSKQFILENVREVHMLNYYIQIEKETLAEYCENPENPTQSELKQIIKDDLFEYGDFMSDDVFETDMSEIKIS